MTASQAKWDLEEADDPTDWQDSFSFLRSLDSSLRCELCFVRSIPPSLRSIFVCLQSDMAEHPDSASGSERVQSCLLLGMRSKRYQSAGSSWKALP